MGKAEDNPSITNGYFTNTTAVGSFDRRVCNSLPCEYEGLFGIGCNDGIAADACFYGGNIDVPSYTTTGVGNPANDLMVSEGAMWDLWSTGFNVDQICAYGADWSPGYYDILGVSAYSMACPAARKIPRAQADPTNPGNPGACTPANLCDGMNFGIQNGFTTYVASDGHAVSQDYRGVVMHPKVLPNGTQVLQGMWPQGY
jgi:hypothetical protein